MSDNFYGNYKDSDLDDILPRLADTPTRIDNMIEFFLAHDGAINLNG